MKMNMSSGSTGGSKLAPPPVAVQNVTKASSDELLKKFAQQEEEEVGSQLYSDLKLQAIFKRRRRHHKNINITTVVADERMCVDSPSSSRRASWPEKRSLLIPIGKRRSTIMGRSRVRDFNNKSIFGTIHKTWRRTVEGASKVFVEKHFYNRHKRLINDPLY